MSKILVIDDDAEARDILRTRLELAGHAVSEAANGEEGLKLVESSAPDIIVLDVMMPKVDGWLVCRILKSNKKTEAIPVVMLTARTQQIEELRGWESGADEYLTKPCDHDRLLAVINRLLAPVPGDRP